MLDRGLSIASVTRNFSTIRSIINLTISEQGLDCGNAFARTLMPEEDRQRRLPIPIDCIRVIQSDCHHMDDEMRWLVALLSDTGMRLSEAAGLAKDDIVLDADIPHIIVSPHPWRRLKTKGNERLVPLVGASLWAAKRLQQHDSSFAVPRYCDGKICNANSASAALNKWLKQSIGDGYVMHSFRHSMRDRLRAVSYTHLSLPKNREV